MERVIILGIIIVTPKRSKQIEKGCITKWDLQTSIFLGLLYQKLYHLALSCSFQGFVPSSSSGLEVTMARSQFFHGWIIKEEQKYWGWTFQQPWFNNNNQYWGVRSSALARKRLNVKYPENQEVRTGSKSEYSDVHIEIVNIPLHSRSLTHPQIVIFQNNQIYFSVYPLIKTAQKTKTNGKKNIKSIQMSPFSPKIIPQNS